MNVIAIVPREIPEADADLVLVGRRLRTLIRNKHTWFMNGREVGGVIAFLDPRRMDEDKRCRKRTGR